VVYFGALGLSQVRFMRYTLPLMPAFSIFAVGGIITLSGMISSAAAGRHFRTVATALCTLLGAVALYGSSVVLFPFVTVDPRDAAAQFLQSTQKTPTTVGLVSPPWFWTPPLSPQDAPPGSGIEVTSSPDGRYKFAVTGFDRIKLQSAQPEWFVISEYEWMEKERLRDPQYENFMKALDKEYSLAARFPVRHVGKSPYVPHDYLYTHPEVRIYRRGQAPLNRTDQM
jgi:hypothetical protein